MCKLVKRFIFCLEMLYFYWELRNYNKVIFYECKIEELCLSILLIGVIGYYFGWYLSYYSYFCKMLRVFCVLKNDVICVGNFLY